MTSENMTSERITAAMIKGAPDDEEGARRRVIAALRAESAAHAILIAEAAGKEPLASAIRLGLTEWRGVRSRFGDLEDENADLAPIFARLADVVPAPLKELADVLRASQPTPSALKERLRLLFERAVILADRARGGKGQDVPAGMSELAQAVMGVRIELGSEEMRTTTLTTACRTLDAHRKWIPTLLADDWEERLARPRGEDGLRKPTPGTTHLRIQAIHGKGFRRAGRKFSSEPTLVPIDELTAEQIHELLGHHHAGVLRIEQVSASEPAVPSDAPAAKPTNKRKDASV